MATITGGIIGATPGLHPGDTPGTVVLFGSVTPCYSPDGTTEPIHCERELTVAEARALAGELLRAIGYIQEEANIRDKVTP